MELHVEELVVPLPKTESVAILKPQTKLGTGGNWFLKGPIPLEWLTKALRLGGKAPHVALAIRFQHGMRPTEPVALTATLLRKFGCDNRQSAYRALNGLAKAGLVSVNRSKGKCPRVTLTAIDSRSVGVSNATTE